MSVCKTRNRGKASCLKVSSRGFSYTYNSPIREHREETKNALKKYKDAAIQASKDLEYPKKIINDIKCAKTSDDVSIIMEHARKAWL